MIKSYKLRRNLSNAIIYLILGVMCLIWVAPFVYLLLHSLRADGGVLTNDALLPKWFTFQHYIDLFAGSESSSLNFPKWFMNTFVVACFSCVISTISVLAVAYAFSRLRFGIRKTLMNIAMILGMFPGFMTMIAIYYLLKIMHLDGNLIALVLCYSCGAGLGFQISKGFFDTEHLTRRRPSTAQPKTRSSGRSFFRCLSLSLFTRFSPRSSVPGQTLFSPRSSWATPTPTTPLPSVCK